MSAWQALAIVFMVAAITYAMRASVIVALGGRELPLPVARALRQVGPAVLAALACNLAFGGDGRIVVEPGELAALMVGGAVAWRTRNLIASLVSAMTVLWVASALL